MGLRNANRGKWARPVRGLEGCSTEATWMVKDREQDRRAWGTAETGRRPQQHRRVPWRRKGVLGAGES